MLTKISTQKSFAGAQMRFSHPSSHCQCEMHFSLFVPPIKGPTKIPLLWWLSGLTCTDENFVAKAGAQYFAAQYGLAILAPDTSPRGLDVPDDVEYDLGQGAGFYVDATNAPWRDHYKMYSYIVEELPALVASELAADLQIDMDRQAISGHSMGGHGALVIGLRNCQRFASLSAFAPIVSPLHCPWGQKALGAYLGENRDLWRAYDSCALLGQTAQCPPILIDQGDQDPFLQTQIKPELLRQSAQRHGHEIHLRMQAGYDHSYFFIASFMEDHIRHHSQALGQAL